MKPALLFAVFLAGCATGSSSHSERLKTLSTAHLREAPVCDAQGGFECDRRAILAMAGAYRVTFHFEETVVLKAGYTPIPPKDTGALELVVVVSDEPNRIELQHLLYGGLFVIKHWRQVWEYESPSHFVFTGDQHFDIKERSEDERRGTWTQAVYEVSDAPRYAGLGKWNHRYGVSTWTSERTWRPLPRREYSKRDDYQVINAENRHTVTPAGWAHEQDNTKVIRAGGKDQVLVREFGFNEYTRIDDKAETAVRYWKETAPFWAAVREKWVPLLAAPLTLNYPVNEEEKVLAVLKKAEAFRTSQDLEEAKAWLDAHFAQSVTTR